MYWNRGVERITVVSSRGDPASANIAEKLKAMGRWEVVENGCFTAFTYTHFTLVEIDEYHIYQDGIDTRLEECNIKSGLIIFASKHRSENGRKILTVHPTGNTGEPMLGGRPRELAIPAPCAMRSLLHALHRRSNDTDFGATLEATHHGPTMLHTPSLYIEIGSGEEEWIDDYAGKIVAEAILALQCAVVPVAVGFGGGHYAPRQTKLTLEAEVAFGHIFPNYQLERLDEGMIREAFLKSGADFGYIDRKAMRAAPRNELVETINGLGYRVLREREIRGIGVKQPFTSNRGSF